MSKETTEIVGIEVIEAQQRAEYDIQITTAKKFPRDIERVKSNCISLVTMDNEVAESCRYSIPRSGKFVSGPSVHMARILAQQFCNIRIDSRVKQITDTQVISESVCFDLETNYACKVELRRSILQNEYANGKLTGKKVRMNEDMVTVVCNASNAIALRNAVLNVIPKSLTEAVYKAALQKITGDLSDESKLTAARQKIFKYFNDKYSISVNQILNTLGVQSVDKIKAEQIADLKGMAQSLKDGDSTVEDMFTHKSSYKKAEEKKNSLKKSKSKTQINLP